MSIWVIESGLLGEEWKLVNGSAFRSRESAEHQCDLLNHHSKVVKYRVREYVPKEAE